MEKITATVSGGNGSIGKALALAFARKGYNATVHATITASAVTKMVRAR